MRAASRSVVDSVGSFMGWLSRGACSEFFANLRESRPSSFEDCQRDIHSLEPDFMPPIKSSFCADQPAMRHKHFAIFA